MTFGWSGIARARVEDDKRRYGIGIQGFNSARDATAAANYTAKVAAHLRSTRPSAQALDCYLGR
jgi:hypothetical protein